MIATAPHFGPPPPDRGAEIHRPLTGGLADGLPDPAVRPVRVALVDDEAGIHQLLSGIFRKHASQWILDGYHDATNALNHIPKAPPQAVIMDILMPGIQGIECAKRLKLAVPELPIIMLSAHLDAETLGNCLMAGACGCLFKPAAPKDIVAALKKAMAGSLAFCPRAEKTMLEYFANLGKKYDRWPLDRAGAGGAQWHRAAKIRQGDCGQSEHFAQHRACAYGESLQKVKSPHPRGSHAENHGVKGRVPLHVLVRAEAPPLAVP